MTKTRALRLIVAPAVVGVGLSLVAPATANAAPVTATLVNVVRTDLWPVPSPDPSGITYNRTTGQLIISDAEVDEMPIFQGKNLFVSTLGGTQVPPGGVSRPWSNEPTGVAYRSFDRNLFVSDDDLDRVFQVDPGADGIHGTSDDAVRPFSTGVGNTDAEDLAVDLEATADGHLLVVDGSNKEVFDYAPGPDRLVGTADDSVTRFDVRANGALDPEGIAVHPTRGTILVVDQDSRTVYEYDRAGRLLNTVSIAAADSVKAAGVAVAPASDGSGRLNLYIVDRGVDNNDVPTENDGKFYEMSVDLPPLGGGTPTNTAPVVNAGPDTTTTMPNPATLQGSVTDDGLPSGALTISWAKASGPGTVTFANRNAASTTATFSLAGTYVLRLRATDGALARTDTVTVAVSAGAGGAAGTLDRRVAAKADDAEERTTTGAVALFDSDLEMSRDGTVPQIVGLRFRNITVPKGATITRAYVQFTSDQKVSSTAVTVSISGEAADNSAAFTTTARGLSARAKTSAVPWAPAAWPTAGAAGVEQRTADLSSVVQQIVARPGWASGRALSLFVSGSGTGFRSGESFDGAAVKAPVLHLEWTV